MRNLDRLLRPLARRLIRSRKAARLTGVVRNARRDVLDPHVTTMLRSSERLDRVKLDGADVAEMRASMERSCWLGAADPPAVPTLKVMVGDCPGRLYVPPNAKGALLFLHGGGWVVGTLDSHDVPCRKLALGTGRVVVALDYPLAPEHPWPAAIHAVAAAWRALPEVLRPHGIHLDDVGIIGDSAGGNLATNVCRVLHKSALAPRFQVLIYPGLDPLCTADSHREFAEGFILTETSIKHYLALYAPDPDHPLGNPLKAPRLELPPAVVTVAGFDPLRDEGLAYAALLQSWGVKVGVLDESTLTHGYLNYDGLVPEADRALARIVQSIRAFDPKP